MDPLLTSLVSAGTALVAVIGVKSGWKGNWNNGLGAIAADPTLLLKRERIVLVQQTIRLLINPTEADHQEVYRLIETALRRIQTEESTDSETKADVENFTRLSQAILIREWERVKRAV